MTKVSLAPLQGFTNYHFRNAFVKCFSGVDRFYSPWIRYDGKGEIKKSQIRDVDPENNAGIDLIPQIMCKEASDFVNLSKYLDKLGYSEVNWNLGCPYPMVTKRGFGSSLLSKPQLITQILEESLPRIKAKVGLKLRLGFQNPEDIQKLLPLLDQFPLSEIIIHARTADQMYKGKVLFDKYLESVPLTKHSVIYNGDIITNDSYSKVIEQSPNIDGVMIGRGLISNPFLAEQIKYGDSFDHSMIASRFEEFHSLLLESYSAHLTGDKHILIAMKVYWEYFCQLFPNPHKAHKRIKKAKSLDAYRSAVKENYKL